MSKVKYLLGVLLTLYGSFASAQDAVVGGKVLRPDKTPAPGITVTQKGTNNATMTTDQGIFKLNVSGKNPVLLFTGIGFENQEMQLTEVTSSVTVDLIADSKQLGEVVVTALGIRREKRSLAYATQTIGGEKMGEARETNIINGLQGKVAGLTITKSAGGPGSKSKVILRGNRSIDGNNQPLYVIDGVPLDNGSNSDAGGSGTFGGRDGGDGIGMLNPDEVETMQILKGGAAAALYGAAGQNGAIIITTKKGKSGKIAVDINSGLMLDKAAVLPELQSEYAQGIGGKYKRDAETSWGPKISGQTDTLWNGSVVKLAAQTDRLKNFFRTGTSLTNSVSATGGSDKMQTYFFYGNTAATGIVRNHDLTRHNVTLRINNNISSRLSLESKVSYIFEDVDNKPFIGEAPNSVLSMYRAPVTIPLSEMQKFENPGSEGTPVQSYWRPNSSILENPYWILNRESFYERKDRIIGLIAARYQFNDWISLQVRGSLDRIFEKREEKISNNSYFSAVGSTYNVFQANRNSTNLDALLSVRHAISKNLLLSGNLGGAIQEGKYEGLSVNSRGLYKQNFFFLANAKNPLTNNYYGLNPLVQSLYATANLAYRNYLFLDITARNDWSSALPINNASYFYPSVGVTAVLSDMLAMPAWVSFGKVRLSYAGSGNGGNPYNTQNYYFIGANGAPSTSSVRANPDYKPELTGNYEVGLEWRFFNNRLGFDLALYQSKTKNQLLKVKTPQASLFDSKYINAGLIENKGIELMLSGTPVKTRHFSWDMLLNYSTNKNKVIRLDPNLPIAILIEDRDADIVVKEGGSYGDMYVQGWQKDSLGRRLVNADGRVIKTQGKTEFLGNYNPDWAAGLSNSLTYKNFSFSFLIDHRQGGFVIAGTQALIDADGHSIRSLEGRNGLVLDAYTADGKKNVKSIEGNQYWSDIGERYPVGQLYAYTATNTRLREATLGFQLPASVVEKTGFLRSAKISLVGRNLFFFKRDAPYDPELAIGTANGGGLEYGTLPSTRSYGVNLKLSF
jgi:TonB-linked SusC/RagA family outer membrane protein